MRIKFLSVIVSCLLLSFAITSCLGSDEVIQEYSSDATIHAFALDTVLGKSYRFTIDQLRSEIYNQDSLPVGSDTIIDKILVDTLNTASGYVVLLNKEGKDSILNKDATKLVGLTTTDSVDLRKPLRIKVLAPEAINMALQGIPELQYEKYIRRYTIKVNVHQQDPDSLNWGQQKGMKPAPVQTRFSGGAITGEQKAVLLNHEIIVFSKSTTGVIAYKTETTAPKGWRSAGSVSGLPLAVNLSSMQQFNKNLYVVADKKVYSSTNGTLWTENKALNVYPVITLLTSYPIRNTEPGIEKVAGLSAVVTAGAKTCFAITDDKATSWNVNEEEEVPAGFPQYNISSTVYINNIGVQAAMLMGSSFAKKADEEETKPIVPWGSYTGKSWADLSTESKYCPILTIPSIIRYGKEFYAFGNDFAAFYTSAVGITWEKANKKFYFPKELTDRAGSNYSMVVDERNFIWIICSKNAKGTDDVWRCRLNKLGFAGAIKQ